MPKHATRILEMFLTNLTLTVVVEVSVKHQTSTVQYSKASELLRAFQTLALYWHCRWWRRAASLVGPDLAGVHKPHRANTAQLNEAVPLLS